MSKTTGFDPTAFFDAVREPPFSGHITEGQVSGMTALLDAWFAGSSSNAAGYRKYHRRHR
jgi:hypothetical protein